MAQQRRRDTGPELALRRVLHARGLRYFVHRRPLPELRREADLVFPTAKVAVFVDGCFWHGCPEHGRRRFDVNGWYWPAKIERNRLRDADTTARIMAAGWGVIRIWEHERPDEAAVRIMKALLPQRRRQPASGLTMMEAMPVSMTTDTPERRTTPLSS